MGVTVAIRLQLKEGCTTQTVTHSCPGDKNKMRGACLMINIYSMIYGACPTG